MKCAVDRNMSDPLDIAPLGCKPVSLDRCESGYMASKENVSLPGGENASMDQCCQCRPGETCGYCEKEAMCTDEEKRRYVAEEENVSMYLHPLSKKRKRLPALHQNMKKMFHSRASRGGRNIYGLSFYSVS